jgi:hypothetical protein
VTSIELSFCCNGKTQPYYWLATDHNYNNQTKKQGMTEREEKNSRKGQKGKTRNTEG